jgi:putative transposase
MRKALVDRNGSPVSVRRQCELLGINRNRLEPRRPAKLHEQEFELARRIDEVHLRFPEFGARRMSHWLNREEWETSRRQVGRVMKVMGLEAIYRKPRTSQPGVGQTVYPYLLRNREVKEADEVWCADITYIPMARGYAYLVAVMDWKSRAVLSWELSNTLESGFCVRAFQAAVKAAGKAPQIFNTDQGSQFTSQIWLEALLGAGVQVSMDGKGRWMDNVFIERLWRSVKHEGVYLWAHETLHDVERALERWFAEYNKWKPHQALDYKTPWECYRPEELQPWKRAA